MEEQNKTFAEMFEESSRMKPIHNGMLVEGTILEVTGDTAVLDIGSYLDGILTQDQLLADGETMDQYPVGTQLTLVIKKVDTKNSQVILSKKDADRLKDWTELDSIKEGQQPITVKVANAVKGGLRVRYKAIQGFIPASQVDTKYTEDLTQFAGQELDVLILEVNHERHEFTASRRDYLKKQRAEQKAQVMATVEVGAKLEGKVVRIENYGAFVEIAPGVSGLLHVSDMSWSRIKHPGNVVKVGDVVSVAVNSVDQEKGRIGLSLKALVENPWENMPIDVDDILDGCTVNRIITSGAFVQVGESLEGFLPISQIVDRRLKTVSEVLKEGELINVKILSIDKEQQRISVSMKGIDQPEGVDLSAPVEEETAEEAVEAPVEE